MRSPRRSFTAPFVVTMVGAVGSVGFTSCNPPSSRPGPDPLIAKNPPPPTTDPQPEPSQPGEQRWTVYQQGKDCFASEKFDCPKPATPGGPMPTCNPPPPIAYACPENVMVDYPYQIAQWSGETTCHVVPQPIKCPEGAICNPPPPTQVACPTR
jgi:hypothetical protein